MLRSGEKLNPEIVEAAYQSPMIDEIAVLVQDGKLVGLVVPSAKARTGPDMQSAESAVREALSSGEHKLRSYLHLVGFALCDIPLPRTELGKLRRHLLPTLYRAAREQLQVHAAEAAPALEDRAMLKEPVAQRIWNWLKKRFPSRDLRLDTSLQLDLGVDSLELVALTMELERDLGITLGERALENVNTLRDLIEVALAAKPAPTALPAGSWIAEPNCGAAAPLVRR